MIVPRTYGSGEGIAFSTSANADSDQQLQKPGLLMPPGPPVDAVG